MEKARNNGLFDEFQNTSEEEWYQQAKKEIKKDDLNLITDDGIFLKPIYSRNDLKEINKPFKHNNKEGWLLIERIEVGTEDEANRVAIKALEGSADGINFFIFDAKTNASKLLKGIWLEHCIVSFTFTKAPGSFINDFLNFVKEEGFDSRKLRGWINYDPFVDFIKTGKIPPDCFEELKVYFESLSQLPTFKFLTINSHQYSNSGTNIIQELTFTLSCLVEYLEALKIIGISTEEVAEKIIFSLTVSTSYFLEISKLRAFRLLVSKIYEGYGIRKVPESVMIHCQTSSLNKSFLDWENNIIRNAAEAMAAILGGANFLTVTDHNINRNAGKDLSRRISRNISHLLREEAYLDKTVDPAAGSYYLETITNSIATKAWQSFLDLEEKGGFIKAVKAGIIANESKETVLERKKKFYLRKDLLIGVNVYPNFKEAVLEEELEIHNGRGVFTEERIAAATEDLRRWVENKLRTKEARPKAIVIAFKDSLDKDSSLLLKNILSSSGFLVEFKNQLEEWPAEFVKGNSLSYDLYLIYLDNETFTTKAALIQEMSSKFPVILTSSKKIDEISLKGFNYLPLENLAEPSSLKNLLKNIID